MMIRPLPFLALKWSVSHFWVPEMGHFGNSLSWRWHGPLLIKKSTNSCVSSGHKHLRDTKHSVKLVSKNFQRLFENEKMSPTFFKTLWCRICLLVSLWPLEEEKEERASKEKRNWQKTVNNCPFPQTTKKEVTEKWTYYLNFRWETLTVMASTPKQET